VPYVYRYTDKNDDAVKYVGIIKNESNFPKRFEQHRRDSWFPDGNWLIEYVEVDSVTDAEALEGHLIHEYRTYDYYNKAKASWGRCTFAPDPNSIKWKIYKEGDLFPRSLADRIDNIYHELIAIKYTQNDLEFQLNALEKIIDKDAQALIRKWAEECVVDNGQLFFTWQRRNDLKVTKKSFETLFDNYLEWQAENLSDYEINNIDEFKRRIRRNSRLRDICDEEGIYAVLVGSEEYRAYEKIRREIDNEDMKKLEDIWKCVGSTQ